MILKSAKMYGTSEIIFVCFSNNFGGIYKERFKLTIRRDVIDSLKSAIALYIILFFHSAVIFVFFGPEKSSVKRRGRDTGPACPGYRSSDWSPNGVAYVIRSR